jgi:hypothetical protein
MRKAVEEVSSQQREDYGAATAWTMSVLAIDRNWRPNAIVLPQIAHPDDGVTSKNRTLAHLSASNSRLTLCGSISNRIEIDDLVRVTRVA